MQDSEPTKALFDKWLAPLRRTRISACARNVIAGIGNTDHLSFRAAGVPGFNPIQEYKDYDVRMHHTNVDLYERVREQDLKQNAVVMAWFAWQAATPPSAFPGPDARGGHFGRRRHPDQPPRGAGPRSRLFAKYFGQQTEAADAFNAAFRIPNLLQNLFGEGALSGSFIPVHAGAARARRARGGRAHGADVLRAPHLR